METVETSVPRQKFLKLLNASLDAMGGVVLFVIAPGKCEAGTTFDHLWGPIYVDLYCAPYTFVAIRRATKDEEEIHVGLWREITGKSDDPRVAFPNYEAWFAVKLR